MRIVIFILVLSTSALAAAPPPDIQAIMDKARSGQKLTNDEQQQLRAWFSSAALGADPQKKAASPAPDANPMMPADVAEIMRKLREQGIPPTEAEKARLKEWATGVKANKAEILQDAKEKSQQFQDAAPPPSPSAQKDPNAGKLLGIITVNVQRTVDTRGKGVSGHFVDDGEITFPVQWFIHEPVLATGGRAIADSFALSFTMDASKQAHGDFRHTSHEVDHGDVIETTYSATGSAGFGQAVLIGELNFDPKAPRPYLSAQAQFTAKGTGKKVTHNKNGDRVDNIDNLLAAPLAPLSVDDLRGDVYWVQAPGIAPGVAQTYGIAQKLPPELKAAIDSARFTLDARALKDAVLGGQELKTPATYTLTIDKTDPAGTTSHLVHTATLKFSLPPRKPELRLEPDDRAAYEKWVPNVYSAQADQAKIFGLNAKDPRATVKLRVSVVTPDGSPAPKTKLEIWLRDVSKLKGTTTNWPDNGSDAEDLAFSNDDENPDWTIDRDRLHAVSKQPSDALTITVASLDPAAYGKVKAEAPELQLHGEDKKTGFAYVALPFDLNDNHIADQWESDNNATGLSVLWDEDETPAKQRNAGDGFTLFEEYRGFVVLTDQGATTYKHVRTDPHRKDLFLWDADGLAKKYAEPLNPNAYGGLAFHYVDKTTMKWIGDPANPDHRRMNMNTPDDKLYARQYGLYVLLDNDLHDNKGPYDGGAQFWKDPPEGVFVRSMRYTHEVRVNFASSASKFTGMRHDGFTDKEIAKNFIDNERHNLMVHEIGHAIGVHHHMPEGKKFTVQRPPGDWPETDGDPNPAQNSQIIGVENCVMRYPSPADVAKAKKRRLWPSVAYFCRKNDMYVGEDGKAVAADNCWEQINLKTTPGE
jgi:hypothetical protein